MIFLSKCHILSYYVYNAYGISSFTKDLRTSMETKLLIEEASVDNLFITNFTEFKMATDKFVLMHASP